MAPHASVLTAGRRFWKAPASVRDVSITSASIPVLRRARFRVSPRFASRVAFATRPYLKWRDLYDLWWIGTQTTTRLDMPTLCRQFLHNLGAYNTLQGLPPAEALALFLSHNRQALVAQADPDLKTWLPEALWKQLQGDGVRQMVDYVFQAIGEVCTHLRQGKPAPGNVNA